MRKILLITTAMLLGVLGATAANIGINVGGVEVTTSNLGNITGENIIANESGKSYGVTYNETTKTLTLTNVIVQVKHDGNFAVHNRSVDGLTIVFNNHCRLSAWSEALKCEKSTTLIVNDETNLHGGEVSGSRGLFLKGANLTITGAGSLYVYAFNGNSGINGDKGTETVTTSVAKLQVDANKDGAALKNLGQFTVKSRNSSGSISTQVILQDGSVAAGAKYTENVKAMSFGSGVSVTRPMGAVFNASSGFVRDSEVLTPYVNGKLVISDERDNASYTTVGNFQYTVSNGVAWLENPTMAYRKTRPTIVVIPGYVTIGGTLMPVRIEDEAFEDKMPEVTRVDIRYGVQSIGRDAFADCSNLTRITIPSSVWRIGSYIIYGTMVSEIYWASLSPSSVSVSSDAFAMGTKGPSLSRKMYLPTPLARDAVPSSCPDYYTLDVSPNYACDFSNNGTYYVVTKEGSNNGTDGELAVVGGDPNSIFSWSVYTTSQTGNGARYYPTSIAPYAFYNKTTLTNANLSPSSLKTVGEYAFYGCSGLQTVSIGSGVTTIGSNAFTGCTGVRTVNWNAANYSYSGSSSLLGSLFNTNITTVTIGSAVTTIPNYLCENLSKLTSVSIPSSVTTIGAGAFNATGLTSVTIPSSVTTIGAGAFRSTGLTSVTLPSSLTTIGSYAFNSCSKLQSITIPAGNIFSGTFGNCTALQMVTIGIGVRSIATDAFTGCTALRTINWNAANWEPTWTDASQSPFYNFRDNITAVTFGNTVTRIPAYLCNGFTKITSVSLPWSVTSIGGSAFTGCTALANVSFGNSLETIGMNAFQRCLAMAKADLSVTRLTSIGENAFAGCTAMTQLSLPKTLTTIGKQAFLGCSGLKKLALPEGVETLEMGAFALCTGLTTFSLPVTVTSIGAMAFLNDNALVNFYALPRCADIEMGDNVFSGASTSSCKLHVKQGQLDAYKKADQWKDFFNIVGDQEDPDYNPLDVNNDGSVNVGDVNVVLAEILAHPDGDGDSRYDVSGDGAVNVGDVNVILAYIIEHPE